MPATSSCRCYDRGYLHAHCFCPIYNCDGKAVSRSTYQQHRRAAEEAENFPREEPQEPAINGATINEEVGGRNDGIQLGN